MIHRVDVEKNINRFLNQPESNVTGHVIWQAIQFTAKEKAMALPSSFTRSSSMNLVTPKLVDTSDRSLVEAFSKTFRSGGDETDLERPMFYLTPYLTCDKCNSLMFIDAANARNFGARMSRDTCKRRADDEVLGMCPSCASTANLQLGAHDFLDKIAGNKAELIQKIKIRHSAAFLVGRSYRFYLQRQCARAHRTRAKVWGYLNYFCAAIIEAILRGRLGRRRAQTCAQLHYIRKAHPISLNKALSPGGEIKVFWYKSKEQVRLLFENYLVLAERTGFLPPRYVVESNVREIARRIKVREYVLITLVQSRWRGITVRKLIVIFRYEVIRIRGIRAAACFKLTRLWRGWITRRELVQTRLGLLSAATHLRAYTTNRSSQRNRMGQSAMNKRLRYLYVEERAEERAARFCGLVHPSATGGNKMGAFQTSSFGNDNAALSSRQIVTSLSDNLLQEKVRDEKSAVRGRWLKIQCAKSRQLEAYHAEEVRVRSASLIKSLTDAKADTRAFTLLQRRDKTKKFKYPARIYRDQADAL
mmetsp:Transcript_2309/g.7242  ORF Transcript_2309/g.7242 Transcript_2309/m.7242 type:complete len:531 (-) Transcript_2309:807-2399(-)